MPHELSGTVSAIPSKSIAHRAIILAALCDATTDIDCVSSSADIEATTSCIEGLRAMVSRTKLGMRIVGRPSVLRRQLPVRGHDLDCGESGSTLRFLIPVVAALGSGGSFYGHGRLAQRPLGPLVAQLAEHGVSVSEPGTFPLVLKGRLAGGTFRLPGNVSSQFVSGLLMAAPLLDEPTCILVEEPLESLPYVRLTMDALGSFGVDVRMRTTEVGGIAYRRFDVMPTELVSPGAITIEGDWSNSAFWLAAGASSRIGIEVRGLDTTSAQGDRAILAALALQGARVGRTRTSAACRHEPLRPIDLDVSSIPDLVPPLAAVAAITPGSSRLRGAGRLRMKESDRLETVSAAIVACGGEARVDQDCLLVSGRELCGGVVDAANDHRIAMMAAVLATRAQGPVTIRGAECVEKSYPSFWDDYESLGGKLERL